MTEIKKDYIKRFAKAALIRALRTWAQAFIACMPVTGATLGNVDWLMCASSATLAAILSVLTSIATSLPEVEIPDAISAEVDADDLNV